MNFPRIFLFILGMTSFLPHALHARVSREVLAFYYGWYGNPQVSKHWVHWSDVALTRKRIGNSTHYPRIGPYDSHAARVVEQQCRWARKAGITGFIVSWWGQGDFHDQGMPLILDKAQKYGLKITAYFEIVPALDSPTIGGAVEDVLYLLKHYGRHSAWLTVQGKPVLFVYERALQQLKMEGWEKVIREVNRTYPGGVTFIGDSISEPATRVFDGIHAYNPTGETASKSIQEIRAWSRSAFRQWVKTAGDRIACVTVIPGFDDTKLGRPEPRPLTNRHKGKTYRVMWEEAIAADPDWVLVTSWNEWHEGSEIEPSIENGRRELKTTAKFARKFRKLQPRKLDVARSYICGCQEESIWANHSCWVGFPQGQVVGGTQSSLVVNPSANGYLWVGTYCLGTNRQIHDELGIRRSTSTDQKETQFCRHVRTSLAGRILLQPSAVNTIFL